MKFGTSGCAVQIEVIEEHEWFQRLPKVARAHKPHDLSMPASAGAVRNLSWNHVSLLNDDESVRWATAPLFSMFLGCEAM
jgi:hypothetical protein